MAPDAAPATRLPPARLARAAAFIRRNGPGLALSAGVAIAAVLTEPLSGAVVAMLTGRAVAIPAVVMALIIGMVLHGIGLRPLFRPGMGFAVKTLLRVAIALLGLRIALGDIAALGLVTVVLVATAMAATLVSGLGLARALSCEATYGALAGAATAVCGASAALATAAVLPPSARRDADTAFVVVAVNALSTLAMVAYPTLGPLFGLDDRTLGILLGATIHDVAQVVGAGYSVSETAGNAAVIVKLFRVFLLLPVVVSLGWWFARQGGEAGKARVPIPVFALAFLALVLVNSTGLVPPAVTLAAGQVSRWGLLIAIGALGLGTSVAAMVQGGWRHLALITGTSLVILAVTLTGLLALG